MICSAGDMPSVTILHARHIELHRCVWSSIPCDADILLVKKCSSGILCLRNENVCWCANLLFPFPFKTGQLRLINVFQQQTNAFSGGSEWSYTRLEVGNGVPLPLYRRSLSRANRFGAGPAARGRRTSHVYRPVLADDATVL